MRIVQLKRVHKQLYDMIFAEQEVHILKTSWWDPSVSQVK